MAKNKKIIEQPVEEQPVEEQPVEEQPVDIFGILEGDDDEEE